MMDEEIRQALTEVQEMKKMCGNINMKLTNIVTQRGQDWKEKLEAEYQRGLEDAWEAARKTVEMADPPYWGVFNEYKNDLFGKISASEAIAKLKAYEEKQKHDDKIEVGDEMRQVTNSGAPTGMVCIVTAFDGEKMSGFAQDGHLVVCSSQVNHWWKKTGNHYDIASILKEMQS